MTDYKLEPRGSVAVLKFKRIGNHDLPLPSRATPGSAGFDMRAAEDVVWTRQGVWNNEPALGVGSFFAKTSLGFAVEIPPGYELQCRPRSGLAAKHLVSLVNSPGTVDADFRGEMFALLICHAPVPPTLKRGDRICQLVPNAVPEFEAIEVDELSDTQRGEGGFGSTGVK
jgi:dUTP pyrophosphatase